MADEEDFEDVDLGTVEVGAPVIKTAVRGSASLIKAYAACPAQAYARITRQPETKGFGLVNGIAAHGALEEFALKRDIDPLVVYERIIAFEAERNKIALGTAEVEEAKLDGIRCISAGVRILNHVRPDGKTLRETLNPEYIERKFTFTRNGRTYVGKMDLVPFLDNGDYLVCDWKTGKTIPNQYELDTDVQFDFYTLGPYLDDQVGSLTRGKIPERLVWLHLRGRSKEMTGGANPRRKSVKDTKDPKNIEYDFPTRRTLAQVEYQFDHKIEPIMEQMENGRWWRNEGEHCLYMCSYFDKSNPDKTKWKCGAKLPCDTNRIIPAVKADPKEISLLDPQTLEQSKSATLKPYS
jgi:hypothetical protein